ncbi:MAG: uroporphyrinogen decarboxylase family protein [Clostridiaceae bacterium]|nr:uroporphyrinogen decarboxylase family protein [Clostridiaceae bacterium]
MLTSKERILNTIYRRSTDHVPVSLYELSGSGPDSWQEKEPSYRPVMAAVHRNCDYLYHLPSPVSYPVLAEQTESRSWRDGDSQYIRQILHTPKGDLTQQLRIMDGVHTTWTTEHYLKSTDDIDKYLSLDFSRTAYDETCISAAKQWIGDRGLVCINEADPVGWAASLFDMSEYLVLCLTEPAKMKYFHDAVFDIQMEKLQMTLHEDCRDIMFRLCGPEYVTPPYLPESLFHDLVTRYVAAMSSAMKKAGAIPRIHSHGRVKNLLWEMAEYTDVLVIDPLEPPPDGDIDLRQVKSLYGGRFTLCGNLEVREFEFSTAERIDEAVKKIMEEAKDGGGFILMPTATPCCVPLTPKAEENLLQFVESGLKYGQY